MENIWKGVLMAAATVAVFVVVVFIFGEIGLEFREYFGTRSADIERTIFEESQSFVHGKKQEASRLYLQYQRADEEGKTAIMAMIPIQFATFDETRHLDGQLREFIRKGKGLQ